MKGSSRTAFTLMEVMVAVMIISVVIAALLQMSGNSSSLFSKVKRESNIGQYSSFLIATTDFGFEDKRITLDKLTKGFSFDSQLRSELKRQKVKIIYTELDSIDMSEFDADESTLDDISEEEKGNAIIDEKQVNSGLVFEIGKTTLKLGEASSSLLRLRIQ